MKGLNVCIKDLEIFMGLVFSFVVLGCGEGFNYKKSENYYRDIINCIFRTVKDMGNRLLNILLARRSVIIQSKVVLLIVFTFFW